MTSTKHLFSRAILSLTHPASLPKLHSLELTIGKPYSVLAISVLGDAALGEQVVYSIRPGAVLSHVGLFVRYARALMIETVNSNLVLTEWRDAEYGCRSSDVHE